MTQAEFASAIGMNLRSYQNLEAGRTTRMTVENMYALMAMGVSLDELMANIQTIDGLPIPPNYERDERDQDDDRKAIQPASAAPQSVDKEPATPARPESKIASIIEQYGINGGKERVPGPLSSMQDLELIMLEFQAWAKRTVGRNPDALEKIEKGIRRLINEVEGLS